MICVASVPHTGTWFTIDFLESLLGTKTVDPRFITAENKLTHFHVGADINRSGFGHENIDDEALRKEYKTYFEKFPSIEESNKLIETHKTIIPVRDPILALITRQNRNSCLSHRLTVRGFEYISGLTNRDNVFFFPIDLYKSYPEKRRLLNALTRFVGVENDVLVDYYALLWSAKNTSYDTSGLKKEYENGNIEAIIKALPSETEMLFNTPAIEKFMSDLGYLDLRWYEYTKE